MENNDHEYYNCQLTGLPNMKGATILSELNWFLRHRLKRFIKRRFTYVRNFFKDILSGGKTAYQTNEKSETDLKVGDCVRIKSRAEIETTLNRWHELKGCGFMEEMKQFCGTKQIVYKKVSRFLDERDYRMHKAKGIFILEGVICQGTIDFGPCDRSCFFFWREEWLDKIG